MGKLKIYALYLPQFHETKENDKWWGKGYTDWKAIKASKPVFKGHNQPRVPLNNNYYNLSNIDTINWQADLAKKYHIDGFCIYHYYSNGQLMMEKPAELLLTHKKIDISYFFCWGNHDFRKNWFNGDKSLLRKQEYGDDEDIKKHYEYLLPFFKDDRYLKIDNKPVFVIYQVNAISNYAKMMEIWQDLLRKDGFAGIYIVAMKCQPSIKNEELFIYKNVMAIMPFEPLNVRSNASNGSALYVYKRRLRTVMLRLYNKLFTNNSKPEVFDYTWANETMLRCKKNVKQFYCVFPDWDNTPRYQSKGVVFKGASPKLFYEYTKMFIRRSIEEKSEILFVNAWNEWGETAYLEPDECSGYANLEAIDKAVKDIILKD